VDYTHSKKRDDAEIEQAPWGEVRKTLRGHLRDRLRASSLRYKDGRIEEQSPEDRGEGRAS
jgi:hypothetical protein